MFEKVAECLQYLHDNNTCHGDVKPQTIYLGGDRVRLIDSYFVNCGKTSYEIILDDPNALSLLSPEQLELYRQRMFDCLKDSAASEMFSLGMCILEAVTVKSAMECYDLEELKVKDSFFAGKMGEMMGIGFSR